MPLRVKRVWKAPRLAIFPANPCRIFLHCCTFSVTLLAIVRADAFGLWAALFPLYCCLSAGIPTDSCFPQSLSQEAAIKTSSAVGARLALSGDCRVRALKRRPSESAAAQRRKNRFNFSPLQQRKGTPAGRSGIGAPHACSHRWPGAAE